jgi:hypothetical protein
MRLSDYCDLWIVSNCLQLEKCKHLQVVELGNTNTPSSKSNPMGEDAKRSGVATERLIQESGLPNVSGCLQLGIVKFLQAE